jgi:hypothetical protein
MDMSIITNAIASALNMPHAPITPIPPPLLLLGAVNKTGLSAREIAANIIAKQSNAGAPVGPSADGSPNISEAMEVIRVQEIINGFLLNARVEVVIPPGIPVTAIGANAGGPIIVQGATTLTATGVGIIR